MTSEPGAMPGGLGFFGLELRDDVLDRGTAKEALGGQFGGDSQDRFSVLAHQHFGAALQVTKVFLHRGPEFSVAPDLSERLSFVAAINQLIAETFRNVQGGDFGGGAPKIRLIEPAGAVRFRSEQHPFTDTARE